MCLCNGEECLVVSGDVVRVWQLCHACSGKVLWVAARPSLRLLPSSGPAWSCGQLYREGQRGVVGVVEGHARGVGLVSDAVLVVERRDDVV